MMTNREREWEATAIVFGGILASSSFLSFCLASPFSATTLGISLRLLSQLPSVLPRVHGNGFAHYRVRTRLCIFLLLSS